MNFLAKYNKLVLSCIVAFFVMMLINHLIFTMQEGLENPPAAKPDKPAVTSTAKRRVFRIATATAIRMTMATSPSFEPSFLHRGSRPQVSWVSGGSRSK